jgi:hypothetical protein
MRKRKESYCRCDEGSKQLLWPPWLDPEEYMIEKPREETDIRFMTTHRIYRIEVTARQWMPCIVGPFRSSSLLNQDSVQDTLAKPNEGTKACQQPLSVQSTRSMHHHRWQTNEVVDRTAVTNRFWKKRKKKKEKVGLFSILRRIRFRQRVRAVVLITIL